MADYVPPVGLITLTLRADYVPPVGLIALVLGPETINQDRTLVVQAQTAGAFASVRIRQSSKVRIAAQTAGATASAHVQFDPNLLSPLHAAIPAAWRAADPCRPTLADHWQQAPSRRVGCGDYWRAADHLRTAQNILWQSAPRLSSFIRDTWQSSRLLLGNAGDVWQQAPARRAAGGDHWRAAHTLILSARDRWVASLPRLLVDPITRWRVADRLAAILIDQFGAGSRLILTPIEGWRNAGYPANSRSVGPPVRVDPTAYQPPIGLVTLQLCGASVDAVGLVTLTLGPPRCPGFAWLVVPQQRTYAVFNTASLVRLPDLTPLPCATITVETDFESWCWALTATLVTPSAWPLVQPNPLACEVRATINGHVWDFLLDVPTQNRTFNSDRVSLKGRSTSAWLQSPYTQPRALAPADARDRQQIAAMGLDNTGWSLDWSLEDWSIPGHRYAGFETPVDTLLRIAAITGDGVYTDPHHRIIRLHKRWPVASWLLDGSVADIAIPEDAILSLSRTPIYSTHYNGVYVGGTTHGVMALVKIAGTDGALQPPDPILHELICDTAGIAARSRGINALSDAGAGFNLEAELLLLPSVGVIRPGKIVSVAGIKAISRSVKITANCDDEGLKVFESVGLERREVEP